MAFAFSMRQPQIVNTPSQGFNEALQGFANYRGAKDSLGAAFYPMLFDGFRGSFGQLGMDPYGASIRQLSAPMSPAEQYRQRAEQHANMTREAAAWRAKWQAEENAKHAAAKPQAEAWIKTQKPDNQRAYRLMMGY
jgi:hypothetical protein